MRRALALALEQGRAGPPPPTTTSRSPPGRTTGHRPGSMSSGRGSSSRASRHHRVRLRSARRRPPLRAGIGEVEQALTDARRGRRSARGEAVTSTSSSRGRCSSGCSRTRRPPAVVESRGTRDAARGSGEPQWMAMAVAAAAALLLARGKRERARALLAKSTLAGRAPTSLPRHLPGLSAPRLRSRARPRHEPRRGRRAPHSAHRALARRLPSAARRSRRRPRRGRPLHADAGERWRGFGTSQNAPTPSLGRAAACAPSTTPPPNRRSLRRANSFDRSVSSRRSPRRTLSWPSPSLPLPSAWRRRVWKLSDQPTKPRPRAAGLDEVGRCATSVRPKRH